MSGDSVRDFLEEQLKPLLPDGWRWVPYQRNLDTIDATTVVWKQQRLERLAEAPLGHVRVSGTVTVISPHTDIARAEEALDDAVLELVTAIDGLVPINWTGAEKVLVNDTNLGWDITVTVITRKAAQT